MVEELARIAIAILRPYILILFYGWFVWVLFIIGSIISTGIAWYDGSFIDEK